MTRRGDARVCLAPQRREGLLAALRAAGAAIVPAEEANVVVWTAGPGDGIERALHDGVEWVQVETAGVENWLESGLVDRKRTWTSARGVYASRVAEHVVALILAAARGLHTAARRSSWLMCDVRLLEGATVGVVGAGAIGEETFSRLSGFGVRRLGLTRSGHPVRNADLSLGLDQLHSLLEESDYVVLAAPLTAETSGLVGSRELELIGSDGWLVNVARGALVDTDALVAALASGALGGACLDVTDPQPLPDGHPLWTLPNVLITPHIANPWDRHDEVLALRVGENLRRFIEGRELLGAIDPERGY